MRLTSRSSSKSNVGGKYFRTIPLSGSRMGALDSAISKGWTVHDLLALPLKVVAESPNPFHPGAMAVHLGELGKIGYIPSSFVHELADGVHGELASYVNETAESIAWGVALYTDYHIYPTD